jgi:hypothetical protein
MAVNNPASKSVDRRTVAERSTSFSRAVTGEAVHPGPAPHFTSHTEKSFKAPNSRIEGYVETKNNTMRQRSR